MLGLPSGSTQNRTSPLFALIVLVFLRNSSWFEISELTISMGEIRENRLIFLDYCDILFPEMNNRLNTKCTQLEITCDFDVYSSVVGTHTITDRVFAITTEDRK
jgi:hypothetical protein